MIRRWLRERRDRRQWQRLLDSEIRGGAHVMATTMADGYDPPSGSLNPADWESARPVGGEGRTDG